jgi:manganese-dependent inorganic pyrophosphatase
MIDIKVVWHKVPDTDCTFASIIFAEYLNKKWEYKATPYIQWKLNNETKYLVELLWIQLPEIKNSFPAWTKIALVDHNEKSQTLDNIWELNIEYLVDHHKIDFSTQTPVNIRMEKICSTCSILYKMYKEAWFEISEKIWKMMLAWILSDSLLFKSTTTAPEDKVIAKDLQEITWIMDLEKFAMNMFNAKSDLWDINAEDLIKYDYKVFNLNWKNIWVWTLETTNPNYWLGRKNEILEWMKNIKQKDWLDFIMLSIVDIIWEKNTTIVLDWNDTNIVEEVFWNKVENNLIDLWRRLSRKKEVIPELTNYFSNI